jgi:hypothetical protein
VKISELRRHLHSLLLKHGDLEVANDEGSVDAVAFVPGVTADVIKLYHHEDDEE